MTTQAVFSNAGYLQPLEIRKGSDLDFTLTLFVGDPNEALNLSLVQSVKATMKQNGVDTPINFTCTLDADVTSGIVHLKLARAITGTLVLSDTSPLAKANYKWSADVQMMTGDVYPICYGPVKIIEGETQWP